ncbi:Gfo/Idh/MocA family oxidoreductase [Pseudomonas sp. MOB-449]|nr:Gfo/Idh/MocA family oxidoreductase [Pseudomonas sp. MOB-449]
MDRTVSTIAPLRVGILSTAKIARTHIIPALRQANGCVLSAISSRSLDRALEVAQEFGIPKAYGSEAQLLADPDIDAVYIPTPNHLHVDQAIEAARNGKHVLCEKPIGLSEADAARLLEAKRRYGVHVTEAIMVRYHPRWLLARDLVRSGRIGDVRMIHATYTVLNDNPGDIRFDPAMGGGALMDVGIYPIAAARFFFESEPISAYAQATTCPVSGVDESICGVLNFPGNRHLMFSGSLRMSWDHWIRIIGTAGSIELPIAIWADAELETEIRLRGIEDINDQHVEVIRVPAANQYVQEFEAFAALIRGEVEAPWPVENAVAGMKIIDALKHSAATGQAQSIQWQQRGNRDV